MNNDTIRTFVEKCRAKDIELVLGYLTSEDREQLVQKYLDEEKMAFEIRLGQINDVELGVKKNSVYSILEATDVLMIYPESTPSNQIETYDKAIRNCIWEWNSLRQVLEMSGGTAPVEVTSYISKTPDTEFALVFIGREKAEGKNPAKKALCLKILKSIGLLAIVGFVSKQVIDIF